MYITIFIPFSLLFNKWLKFKCCFINLKNTSISCRGAWHTQHIDLCRFVCHEPGRWINETWETVVPTSLVALQSSGVAINAEGLPCGDDCIDHATGTLINNNNTISGK